MTYVQTNSIDYINEMFDTDPATVAISKHIRPFTRTNLFVTHLRFGSRINCSVHYQINHNYANICGKKKKKKKNEA